MISRIAFQTLLASVLASLTFAESPPVTVISNSQVSSTAHSDLKRPGGGVPTGKDSIYLPPPTETQRDEAAKSDGINNAAITVTSSLAIVLGLFCGLVWISRKTNKFNTQALPSDVLDVLGTASIDARHQTALIRCGRRILLVALSQSDATTLCEFTDPSEVDELVAQTQGGSKRAFAKALKEVSSEPTESGFVDDPTETRRSLFSRDV